MNIRHNPCYILFLLLTFWLINSCSTFKEAPLRSQVTLKTYNGNELTNQQAFLLTDANRGIIFNSIDGKDKDEKGFLYKSASAILLNPGKHIIDISVDKKFIKYYTHYFGYLPITIKIVKHWTSKPVRIQIDALKAHSYQLIPGVEFDKASKIYKFIPSVDDVTDNHSNNVHKYYFSEAPKHSLEYNFDISQYLIKYIIEPPKSEGWQIYRYKSSSPEIATMSFNKTRIKNLKYNTSYVIINFCSYESEFNESEKVKQWLINLYKEMFLKFYTAKFDFSMNIKSIEKAIVNNKEFLVIKFQASYHKPMNASSAYFEGMAYINKLEPAEISKCLTFILINTSYGNQEQYKLLSDEGLNIFNDIISNFKYEYLKK